MNFYRMIPRHFGENVITDAAKYAAKIDSEETSNSSQVVNPQQPTTPAKHTSYWIYVALGLIGLSILIALIAVAHKKVHLKFELDIE